MLCFLFSQSSKKILRKKQQQKYSQRYEKRKPFLQIGKMSVCEDLGGGRAVQIVKVNDQDPEHSYILDEEALRCEYLSLFR
jgi:hypothetical protein